MTVAFILAPDKTVTLILNGKQHVVHSTHPNHQEILKNLENEEQLKELLILQPPMINDVDLKLEHGIVTFRGLEIQGIVVDKLKEISELGLPFSGLMKFLTNCMRNPRPQAVNELYSFLEHGGFPILPDGCFLGYKKVRSNFMDSHSGTMDNSVGNVVTMPREAVDADPNSACSTGLHVGTLSYVRGFTGDVIILVKVNPEDVVSVPYDYNNQKLRACKYEVIAVYEDDQQINTPYAKCSDYNKNWDDDFDQDEDEDDYDYDSEEDEEPSYPEVVKDFMNGTDYEQVVFVLEDLEVIPSEKSVKGESPDQLKSFLHNTFLHNKPNYTMLKENTLGKIAYEFDIDDDGLSFDEIAEALQDAWEDMGQVPEEYLI